MRKRREGQQDERGTEGKAPSPASRRAPGKIQPGAQGHAEGEHGAKTRRHILEQLQAGPHEEAVEDRLDRFRKKAAWHGKRRLVEDRTQRDEAEKNSERSRYYVERKRGHDDGPSDNRGRLHGVLGHKGHRADYKLRGPDGLRVKGDDDRGP
jgi:hypothetical protein